MQEVLQDYIFHKLHPIALVVKGLIRDVKNKGGMAMAFVFASVTR